MTQEELKEILDFIKENKFRTHRTDGWSFFWSGDVISIDDITRKLRNISRRKSNRKNNL